MSEHRDMHRTHPDSRLPADFDDGPGRSTLDPPWFDDHNDGYQQRRRRWLIIAAAIVPWAVVLGLLVLRGGGDVDAVGEPSASFSSSADPQQHDRQHPAAAGSELTVHQLQGNWRSTPGADAAAAVATMVARSWITGVAPQLDLIGRPDTHAAMYAEHLTVEAIEQIDQTLAVVTLLASVFDGELRVAIRRLAVPIWTGQSTVRPAGQPWWLPEVELDSAPLSGEVVDDPQLILAAAEAISAAGYQNVELTQLERTDAWPWRATVRATTPAGMQVTTPVLLRQHVDRFVVAGTVLDSEHGQPANANLGIGGFLP
ncbi:MAG: hypothetical protein WD576_03100 [Nitriliruptoraceae bacterium]